MALSSATFSPNSSVSLSPPLPHSFLNDLRGPWCRPQSWSPLFCFVCFYFYDLFDIFVIFYLFILGVCV